MPNTNFQTIHQMGSAISNVVKQATGRDPVGNIDMDYVTVAQNKTIGEMIISGNPATFHTSNAVPIQRLLIGMEPIQSGSGDPSPSNVRPITGRTEGTVYRTGKNQGFLSADNIYSEQRCTKTYSTSGVTVESTGNFGRCGYFMPTIQGEIYTVSFRARKTDSEKEVVGVYLHNRKGWTGGYFTIGNSLFSTEFTTYTRTFTAESDILAVGIYPSNEGQAIVVEDFQLELGSSASAYEKYVGASFPVTFPDPPGTVYKGTLDLISGQLTVTHLMQTFTGAESEDWLDSYAINGFRINSRGMKVTLLNTGLCNWLPVLSELGDGMGVALGMNDSDIYVRHITDTLEIADLTEWRAYLAQHPLEVFYPLEPAQYYQVTPQDLNTLVGDNVVFTDGDTLEVMYYQYGEV